MADLHVVHLLWGPLGTKPVDCFSAAYSAHVAGREHDLIAVFNGFGSAQATADARAAMSGIATAELHLETPVQDLDAYRQVVNQSDASTLVFLNSYSEPLVDGWLDLLVRHLDGPSGAGICGATASWESQLSAAPLILKPLRMPSFAAFPNPHLRTNAFAIGRELAAGLRWPPIRRKMDALSLENGRRGLTRQVLDRSLRAVVAGRDGCAYGPEEYRRAATFRSGGQANLLVADNRTRSYDESTPEKRRWLERLAWGDEETP